MTDLEKEVAELRRKYEEPMRKYVAANEMLDKAYWLETDSIKSAKLYELLDKLFPFDARVAASCALSKLEHFDHDEYDVFKASFVRWVTRWINCMKTVEI